MKNKILISISEEQWALKLAKYYDNSYEDLFNTHKIQTFILYVWTQQSVEDIKYWEIILCSDENDLQDKVTNLYSKYEVQYINTFSENLIPLVNHLKDENNEPVTRKKEAFRDKSLQRKFLQDHDPELWIKYISTSPSKVNITSVEEFLWYPFIVKPSSGIQSSGVAILESRKDFEKYLDSYQDFITSFRARGFNNSSLVFEEYIDWEMYSIDYFVDKQWNISVSPPVEVKIGKDIWIDDFMNFVRSFRKEVIKKISQEDLQKFIQSTVDALWIKNTYIHHEFKHTSKWKLKTIEVNGRIWWYRVEMIQEALNFNWLSCTLKSENVSNLENNFSAFLIYPERRWILEWFNEKLFEEISRLPSIYTIRKYDEFLGKEVGLTKQWFTKIAIIKIKNSDTDQFEKDYKFIEDNYKNLTIIK